MKIGIDIQASKGRMTGLGVYTKNLVEALVQEKRNGFQFSFFSKDQRGDWNTLQRLLWENSDLPQRIKKDRVDLLHIPAFSPPMTKPCRMVVTVHDLIGTLFPNQLGWPSRFYWGRWLPQAVKKADLIIADSENTKGDLLKYLKVVESRIRVIYPSGHEGFAPLQDEEGFQKLCQRFGIKEKYFLAVGTLEPRKNIPRVIEAFARFCQAKKDSSPYQLMVVGLTDFAHGQFAKSMLQRCPSPTDVLLTGYVEKRGLNLLYSNAEAFVFPSLYEGFGMPILEAMASGIPVITARTSSLPEVAGDAAFYVDPTNAASIAEGMRVLVEDRNLRDVLIQKGFEQIRQFSWRKTAEQTLEVYRSILSSVN